MLEFGTKKALACIPLDASECKSLLEYAVCQNTTNNAVQFVCQEALIEIEMAGRGLNWNGKEHISFLFSSQRAKFMRSQFNF